MPTYYEKIILTKKQLIKSPKMSAQRAGMTVYLVFTTPAAPKYTAMV
ncbi:MAG: hypothetical protein RRY40_03680 [Oscillospiraceae bacterium]